MIVVLVVLALLIWILLQSRDSRAPVWRARFKALRTNPFVVQLRGDVRATAEYVRSFRLRDLVSPAWWRERLQFKRIWRDFDTF